jgi:glycosyltransferase involved in cell wall biosynthesis
VRHLAIATRELNPLNAGGAGVFVDAAARELVKSGYRVTVLADVPPASVAEYPDISDGLRVAALNALIPQDEWVSQRFPAPVRGLAERTAAALELLHEQTPFDAVEVQDFGGLGTILALQRARSRRMAEVPILVRAHGPLELLGLAHPGRRPAMFALALHAFERLGIVLADAVLTPSHGVAALMADAYGVPPERLVVSPPPLSRILDLQARRPPSGHDLLFIGKLNTVKGVDLLVSAAIEAMQRVPEDEAWRVVLVGRDLPSELAPGLLEGERLRRLIPQNLRDRFVFVDHVKRTRIPLLVEDAFAGVVCSRFESFCLVAHELRALGLPLILTRIPAFADAFEHDISCLYTDGSRADFAEQILRMRREAPLRAALASLGPWEAPQFSEAYDKALAELTPRQGMSEAARCLLHAFDDIATLHGVSRDVL